MGSGEKLRLKNTSAKTAALSPNTLQWLQILSCRKKAAKVAPGRTQVHLTTPQNLDEGPHRNGVTLQVKGRADHTEMENRGSVLRLGNSHTVTRAAGSLHQNACRRSEGRGEQDRRAQHIRMKPKAPWDPFSHSHIILAWSTQPSPHTEVQ